jgi:hypothetical protein
MQSLFTLVKDNTSKTMTENVGQLMNKELAMVCAFAMKLLNLNAQTLTWSGVSLMSHHTQ